MVGGDDNAFAPEYAVAGWFKWNGNYQGAWHFLFRLTMNNKADNQDVRKMGDSVFTVYANNQLYYSFYTYTYQNMVGGGNAGSNQNLPHQGIN